MIEKPAKATLNELWPQEILDQVLARFSKVLLVDDSPTLADMLALFFKLHGFTSRAAYGGSQALDAFAEEMPDIAFIDISMPGMDGMAVARQVRELRLTPPPVLVALTGWEGEKRENAALAAGFDHFLAKPVIPAKIREFMARLVGASDPE